jgi:predicted metal-dependent phosphoesterase TrpH
VDQIHGQGGLAILAHPFSLPRSWLNRKNILNGKFDAIETKNAAQIPFNLMENYNIKLAENLNLPKTAGSDSHIPETVGRTYTIIDSDSIDVFDVIKAIRTGKTETVGKGITFKDRLNKFKRFLSKN